MKKNIKRIVLYILGLFVLANGSALTINANLGVSPIVSLPLVISEIIEINIGIVTTIIFIILILIQFLILRKDFKWINLTQIIFSILFGYFIDLALYIQSGLYFHEYISRFVIMLVGMGLISTGIVLFMEANLVPLPVEGLADVMAKVRKNGKFHIMKIIVDSAFVLIAIPLSLIYFGTIIGIREGTVIGAILVGKLIPLIRKLLLPLLKKFYTES